MVNQFPTLPGVFLAKKKNGENYYRSSLHFKGKHISLGSFSSCNDAHSAYLEAHQILENQQITLDDFRFHCQYLSFEKIVSLLNFRDHLIYIKTPIYLQRGYFLYYLAPDHCLKFDNDDLFYYSSHKIICRQGHMYVNDYGMQYNILARYGIKNFAVCQRDYRFANGDSSDFRYSNVIVVNKYHGVTMEMQNGIAIYKVKLHLNGDYLIGRYPSEAEAAVAYNKAVDLAKKYGLTKNFIENYVTEYSPREYADVYASVPISSKYLEYLNA